MELVVVLLIMAKRYFFSIKKKRQGHFYFLSKTVKKEEVPCTPLNTHQKARGIQIKLNTLSFSMNNKKKIIINRIIRVFDTNCVWLSLKEFDSYNM
jgi:hypothetical protein